MYYCQTEAEKMAKIFPECSRLVTISKYMCCAIIAYGGVNPPIGFLFCNGANVSRTLYTDLFNAIGTAYGEGDGTTTFTLPDLRESTIVGIGENTTKTIASHDVYNLGEFKDDQLQGHVHHSNHTIDYNIASLSTTTLYAKALRDNWSKMNVSALQRYITDDLHGTPRIGSNTHGKQTGCNYIIKYAKSVSPLQEQIIDDNNISGTTTWSSLKINKEHEFDDNDLVDISSLVSKTLGVTQVSAKRYGNLVYMSISGTYTGSPTTGTQANMVGNLPQKYRPKSERIVPLIAYYNTLYVTFGRGTVTSSGSINLSETQWPNGTSVRAGFIYLL